MLETISLQNFKGFKDLENLNTKPITILCGTNSCGKSSILQSILLLKQTLESQNPNQTLLLNGRFVHLGSFENIVFKKDLDNKLIFDFVFKITKREKFLLNSNRITRFYLRDFLDISASQESQAEIYIHFKFVLKSPDINIKNKGNYLKTIVVEQLQFKVEAITSEKQILPGLCIEVSIIDNELYKIKWENITSRNSRDLANGEVTSKIKFTNLFPSGISIVSDTSDSAISQQNMALESNLGFTFNRIKNVLQTIFYSYTYIGPLREEPSRRYIYEDEIVEIGIKGENAAYIYSINQDQKISNHYFYNPQSNSFTKKSEVKLSLAVQEWLELMNIKGFKSEPINEIIHLNLNSNSKTRVSIADVGFGVSQIFPIILEGLRMPLSNTLLLEQPEIHLHPNLQMQMSDYFIGLALSGKKVIVETHSDHIINRLVRRIVEDESHQLKDLIGIYFISSTEDSSTYEEIKIDENRGVVNWPVDFFDQVANEQESILRAGLKKRKNVKK
ncbi:DUF3696 domain-containing protein [Anabaena sp. UHCC 0253]|uniref:DUF3696 domain-containing protein n=1 Tax=Anabaena sp. UHCC 0253 TaxID=2590019 RepID=UPI00144785E8|nr:DUF3696 domain-containing protein [Anabaena sp. UHCC 0253]MTJ52693.1 DUF3696 domain-containing protein [Anabaena sp. UHCC 0253]